MVKTLQEAVAALERDPRQPVRAELDGLEVEIRAVGEKASEQPVSARDLFRELGPWEGETQEEILNILSEGRDGSIAELKVENWLDS